ncbi:MAG: hypothetical protein R8K53_00150 [Mariprofundaceae bacterium]
MKLRQRHVRGLSRFLAGVFAVQLVLTGFCLLSNDAHAMPMAQIKVMQAGDMIDDVAAHCGKAVNHDEQHHSDACFHCDEQTLFMKSASSDAPAFSPLLIFVVLSILPEIQAVNTVGEAALFRTPTGPPRSSSLLYTTSQRIRV